jgi:hypothetical protein
MSLYVRYPISIKTCRNKKSNGSNAACFVPQHSPLSSSSGSLSSSSQSSCEPKKQNTKGKFRYKGHRMLVVSLPKTKRMRTNKKSSGSDSDFSMKSSSTNSPCRSHDEEFTFSSCKKILFYHSTSAFFPTKIYMFKVHKCRLYRFLF